MQKLKCICCDTEIIPIHAEIIPEDQPYSGMYKNGTVDCLVSLIQIRYSTRTMNFI